MDEERTLMGEIDKLYRNEREMADNAAAVIDALLNRQRTARIEAEQWLDRWREARQR